MKIIYTKDDLIKASENKCVTDITFSDFKTFYGNFSNRDEQCSPHRASEVYYIDIETNTVKVMKDRYDSHKRKYISHAQLLDFLKS